MQKSREEAASASAVRVMQVAPAMMKAEVSLTMDATTEVEEEAKGEVKGVAEAGVARAKAGYERRCSAPLARSRGSQYTPYTTNIQSLPRHHRSRRPMQSDMYSRRSHYLVGLVEAEETEEGVAAMEEVVD